jgi:hypothetical protein
LSALGANEVVRSLFRGLIEKIAFFHCFPDLQLAPRDAYLPQELPILLLRRRQPVDTCRGSSVPGRFIPYSSLP